MKRYTKNGQVKTANTIIVRVTKKIDGEDKQFQVINPTEEMIFADGWVEYVPVANNTPHIKSNLEVVQELVTKQWNERTDISNEEALDYVKIVFPFTDYIGKELLQGKIVSYNSKLWRVRQTHICQENWFPSIDAASLWEVIEVEHEGTKTAPIPYTVPMEIFKDKYYTENDTIYLCTRDSETALSSSLSALVGLYVETV